MYTPRFLGALALSLITAIALWAGAGDNLNRQVTGRVARLFTGADNALVLVSEKGVALEVMKIGRGCLVYLNGQRVSPADLRVGLIATLHFNDYTRVVYKLEAVTPPFVLDGVIERIEFDPRRLKLSGITPNITFDGKTTVLLQGKVVFANELKAGQPATVQCAAVERNGVIDRIDKANAKIYLRGTRDFLPLDEGWNLFRGNDPVFITQLDAGHTVSCRKNLYHAVRIDARPAPKPKENTPEEKDMEKEKEKDKEKDAK